jgi:AcrR family transcriptional regulator
MSDVAEIQPQSRDESRRKAIRAALALCREHGYNKLTLKAISVASGVDVVAIQQQWPSLSALVIDAFRSEIVSQLNYPTTDDFAADVRAQLVAIARLFAAPDFGPHLAQLVGAAQSDATVAATFLDRVYGPNRAMALARFQRARSDGDLDPDVDLDVAVDLTFAPLWFRLLLGTGEVTDNYAVRIADLAMASLSPAGHRP